MGYEALFVTLLEKLEESKTEITEDSLKENEAQFKDFTLHEIIIIEKMRRKISLWAKLVKQISKPDAKAIGTILDDYEAASLEYNRDYENRLKALKPKT